MGFGKGSHDCQPKACTTRSATSRFLDAAEWLEHGSRFSIGMPGPSSSTMRTTRRPARLMSRCAAPPYFKAFSVMLATIRRSASRSPRTTAFSAAPSAAQIDRGTLGMSIFNLRPDQRGKLDHLLGESAGSGPARKEGVVEQADHVVDVGDRALALCVVGDAVDAQPAAGSRKSARRGKFRRSMPFGHAACRQGDPATGRTPPSRPGFRARCVAFAAAAPDRTKDRHGRPRRRGGPAAWSRAA